MKKLTFLLLLIITSLGLYSQEPATASEMNERLGRGINMGNTFEAPSETAWSNPWKPEYFRIMAELGFSHVRIPIRWTTPQRSMAEEPYTIYPEFLERIQQAIDTALHYGLHAIINMHHHEELFDDPDGQKDRYLAQWVQIADFFRDYPDSLLFEVLNEPHRNLTPDKWNVFFADALDSIRVTNPTRVVLMGTADFGGLSGVPFIELPDDPYLILSVHYYNPFPFTHQGASWVENSSGWLGTEWHDTEADRETITNEFNFVKQWAQQHNIPIHVGEFGAYSRADLDSRARWTTFVARWFEEQGFSWAYWEFSAGFGIYNPTTKVLLQPLVDALLHNPMPDPEGVVTTLIFENDFQTGTQGWTLSAGSGGAQASLSASDGKLNVNITQAGTEGWHIQLAKTGIVLEKDKMYKVTFAGSAPEMRSFTTYVGRNSSPWTAYSGYQSMSVTANEETYSYAFTMNSNNDSNARIAFDLGMSDVNLIISYIKFESISRVSSGVEESIQNSVRMFPNPVKDNLWLENIAGYNSVALYDITGRRNLEMRINSSETNLDLNHLPSGMYLVVLKNDTKVKSFKIIKE